LLQDLGGSQGNADDDGNSKVPSAVNPLQTNGNSLSNGLKRQSRGNVAAAKEGHLENIEEEETIPTTTADDVNDNMTMAEPSDGQMKRAKLAYFNNQVSKWETKIIK
jgi:hypothetical protein